MTRRASNFLHLIPVCLLLLLFLCCYSTLSEGVRTGLDLSYLAVIPSVFPFAVVTSYMTEHIDTEEEPFFLRPLSSLFSLPRGGGICFLTGLLCGFPLGAKCVIDGYRRGLFSKRDTERMLMFCNNTGPAFLVGAVGGLRGDIRQGWILYGIQCTLAVLTALFTRRKSESAPALAIHMRQAPKPFSQVVSEAAITTLSVVGFVTFFSGVLAVCGTLLPTTALAPIAAILEVGNAARLASDLPFGLSLTAFAVCFSGISVHMQTASLLDGSNISMKSYFTAKMLCGACAGVISALLSTLFA